MSSMGFLIKGAPDSPQGEFEIEEDCTIPCLNNLNTFRFACIVYSLKYISFLDILPELSLYNKHLNISINLLNFYYSFKI